MAVDLEHFRAAVEQFARIHGDGHLRVEVAPNGAVNLIFDPEGARHAPPGGGGLYIDIEDALAAVAAGVPVDDFVRIRSERPGPLGPEDGESAREKYQIIAESSLSEGLQRRAWLRATSKAYVLTSFEWEVVRKLADSSSIPRPTDASETLYALIRLDTERSGGDGPPDQKVTVVSVDAPDLDDLIGGLTSLRAALGSEAADLTTSQGRADD